MSSEDEGKQEKKFKVSQYNEERETLKLADLKSKFDFIYDIYECKNGEIAVLSRNHSRDKVQAVIAEIQQLYKYAKICFPWKSLLEIQMTGHADADQVFDKLSDVLLQLMCEHLDINGVTVAATLPVKLYPNSSALSPSILSVFLFLTSTMRKKSAKELPSEIQGYPVVIKTATFYRRVSVSPPFGRSAYVRFGDNKKWFTIGGFIKDGQKRYGITNRHCVVDGSNLCDEAKVFNRDHVCIGKVVNGLAFEGHVDPSGKVVLPQEHLECVRVDVALIEIDEKADTGKDWWTNSESKELLDQVDFTVDGVTMLSEWGDSPPGPTRKGFMVSNCQIREGNMYRSHIRIDDKSYKDDENSFALNQILMDSDPVKGSIEFLNGDVIKAWRASGELERNNWDNGKSGSLVFLKGKRHHPVGLFWGSSSEESRYCIASPLEAVFNWVVENVTKTKM